MTPSPNKSFAKMEESPPRQKKTMFAAAYHYHGQPDKVVKVQEIQAPTTDDLLPGQLLVKVRNASLNPADWKSGSGEQALLLSFAWPRVYGFDFEGEVVGISKENDDSDPHGFSIGDSVFGMIRGLPQHNRGTLAEYVIVEADICCRTPKSVSSKDAASIPLVGITAVKMFRACYSGDHDDMRELENRDPDRNSINGPRVLITGGSGGVGSVAIQLARYVYHSSFVCTTASLGAKTDLCYSLGAHKVVNYKEKRWVQSLKNELLAKGIEPCFDIILDCTGEALEIIPLLNDTISETCKRLAPNLEPTIVSILHGPTYEALTTWISEAKLDPKTVTCGVNTFLNSDRLKRWGVSTNLLQLFTGANRMHRKLGEGRHFKHVIGTGNGEIMRMLADKMKKGKLKGVIDKEFAFKDAVDAIMYQKSGRAAGKVIVNISDEEKSKTNRI